LVNKEVMDITKEAPDDKKTLSFNLLNTLFEPP